MNFSTIHYLFDFLPELRTPFMQLLHILWQVDPIAFRIGNFSMTWYGIMWGLSILLGYWVALYFYRQKGIPTAGLSTIIQYMFFGGLIGARLGDVIFYDWAYFSAHPIEILKIWRGGLASHGGAIGILLGIYLYIRKYRDIGYLQALDIASPVILLTASLIRIGNLMNSEILGKATSVPWAFIFANYDNTPRHPSQLYEAIMVFLLFILLFMLLKIDKLKVGMITGIFFALSFSLRYLLEFFKLQGNTPQILNIPFVLLGFGIIWFVNKKE